MAVTGVALAAVLLAAGLEGATETRFGAIALLVGAVSGLIAIGSGDLPGPGRTVRGALAVLAAVLLFQAVPLPMWLREWVAPGQTARLHELAGTVAVTTADWLTAVSRFDVAVLLGQSPDDTFDVLSGAKFEGARALALSPSRQAWEVGTWAVYALLVTAGWRIGRNTPTLRAFLLGLIVIGVGEALFGFSNRGGPSTGIGEKVAYLGSATGTFINRGHFAAYLNLAIGAVWGLAAALFPLLPEEVRRHQARKRRSSQPPGLLEASGDKVPRLILLTFVTSLLIVAVVASNSRGPLVSLVASGILVGGWVRWRREEKVHLGFGLAAPAAGLALAMVALGPRGAFGRFTTLGSSDVSFTARVQMWKASAAAFLESPLFGAGPGSWSLAFGPHEIGAHLYEISHAHSEPVELLVELGLLGFACVVVLVLSFVRGVARRLDVVNHDLQTAAGIGGFVALFAVALQSSLDFPFRTPGVGVPFFLVLGVVLSSLEVARPTRVRWPGVVLGVLAFATLLPAGVADHALGGSRRVRRSEAAPALLLAHPGSPEEAESLRAGACGGAAREPFDAWQQFACSAAASRVAAMRDDAEAALESEIAGMRAMRLHPRDPRLQLHVAQVWMRIGPPTLLQRAYDERATRLLIGCVGLDGWRAEDAFRLARKLPLEAADRIGAAASEERVSRSRTLYQYGALLDERGRTEDATRILEQAALADPQYGPPAFRAGVVARRRRDDASASRWFHLFIAARDRPTAMEGWSLLYLDEPAAAEVRFRRALADNPRNRWAWEGVAAVASSRSDRAGECTAWRQVLALTPSHPQAQARTTELGC